VAPRWASGSVTSIAASAWSSSRATG
jgi:hypothetical protein